MSLDDDLSPSEDELPTHFSRTPYETIETLPLQRVPLDGSDDVEAETMATLPLHGGVKGGRQTQPTQLISRPLPVGSSSPAKPLTVQVAASSPIAAPAPMPLRKSMGVLASAMAPAGTAFRRPFAPAPPPRPQPIVIDSDDEGPVYRGGSSDSDSESARRNDIKTSTFVRKAGADETVPESPQNSGLSRFKEITQSSLFTGAAAAAAANNGSFKRYADTNENAYGNVSKKPRQTAPARAMPVSRPTKIQPEMDLDDIASYNERQKVKRIVAMLTWASVREAYAALQQKKGVYDDAVEHLIQLSEKRHAANNAELAAPGSGSEDELMPTPAATRKPEKPPAPLPPKNAVRQQPKAPQKSITQKWSSTQQHVKKDPVKTLDIFNTPPPQQKKRTLIRGRKNRSPSPTATAAAPVKPVIISESDESEVDSGILSEPEFTGSFRSRLLHFFNTCSAADLADMAAIQTALAEHVIAHRPFKTPDAIEKVPPPNAETKGRRKKSDIGEKVLEKVEKMLKSYDAVDYLVKHCESLAKPLRDEMKTWGVDIYGGREGELDMVSLNHDSGIGTPVSDFGESDAAKASAVARANVLDSDGIKRAGSKKFFGQPALMNADIQMKDYQVVGVNWLYTLYKRGLSCILADDMGLGKTCQVIAFLAHLLEQGETGPHLVVVPAATLENWLKEFQRFCPALRVEPYYATNPGERAEMRLSIEQERADINVIVTTYTLAKGKEDTPWLRSLGFCCTIYDEGHTLKNAESQVASKLMRINSRFRLLLTGTPLQNNLKELISLLAFLMPDTFKEKQDDLHAVFLQNVSLKSMNESQDALLSAKRISRARSMLTPFILRRKKYQVLKDLPKKERRVEYCDLSPEQAEIYQNWLDKAFNIRERRERGENVSQESTNILMKLRQAAIHPFLFRRSYPDKMLPAIAKQCLKVDIWRESNPNLIVTELEAYSDMEIHDLCSNYQELHKFTLKNQEWLASGKVQKTLELLRKYIAEGHRTLIFSQFVMVLDILELVFEQEAIEYFRLDGSTKVSERQDLIDEFSAEDNQTPVFMLSTKAGGAGINLAKANKVIVFDSGFNPQDDIQAENRAHRIGQVKEVEVVRLVSRGTVEEQIYAMGLTKLKLDEQVAGDGAEETAAKEGAETKEEVEGRNIVEEMFFKKLDVEGIDEVKAEAASPGKGKKKIAPAEDTTTRLKGRRAMR